MKEPVLDLSLFSRSPSFIFRGCDFTCVWMNGDVMLCAKPLVGEDADCVPLVAFYFRSPYAADGKSRNVCLKLVSERETLFILLQYWPVGSTELKEVNLPSYGRENGSMRGSVGFVRWSDNTLQNVVFYERLAPSGEDRMLLLFGRFLHDLGKPSFSACDLPGCVLRESLGMFAGKVKPDKELARSAGSQLGQGYVFGRKFWIAGDFSRVVTLCENGETWLLQPFTRLIVRVLVEETLEGGLTKDEIYLRAKVLYEADHPEAKAGAPGLAQLPMPKNLVFFFRRTVGGVKGKHPLYDEIEIDGCKSATSYRLVGRWVESVAANGRCGGPAE